MAKKNTLGIIPDPDVNVHPTSPPYSGCYHGNRSLFLSLKNQYAPAIIIILVNLQLKNQTIQNAEYVKPQK